MEYASTFICPSNSLHNFGHPVSRSRGERTDECSLNCTHERAVAGETTLDVAKEQEGHQCGRHGHKHRPLCSWNEHVRQERNNAANNIRKRDRQCAL